MILVVSVSLLFFIEFVDSGGGECREIHPSFIIKLL